jgi:dsDNA-binding SOS-regulon protein
MKANTEVYGKMFDAAKKRETKLKEKIALLENEQRIHVRWITAVEKRLIKLERKVGWSV